MTPDFLIIGAGVAGMRAAIELAGAGSVLVVAKDSLRESSSEYAQGGVAVALSDDDEVALHEQDTLYAGDGLCDLKAVHTLVEEGPGAIQQLIDWGAEFDRDRGRLCFTREAAHSRNRILHAQGDSTGREIARTLYLKAASLPNVEFRSYSGTTDLLLEGDRAAGAVLYDASNHRSEAICARAVLLATGGLGQVFLYTTNPEVATGDGVAMAYRAGAEISDIEFVQFHPTALHVEGAPSFLLSEALRGEGARLVNVRGERFMEHYHPLAELAPRDVVARAIVSEMRRTSAPHVFLDLTHRPPQFIRERFPRVWETCKTYGVDISTAPAPVHPAAHYAMGGVRTDLHGRTSVRGLFAAGEVAATGVHGANRLASNSLLEGVVLGARAGAAMREWAEVPIATGGETPQALCPSARLLEIRTQAWDRCGIERSGEDLAAAVAWFEERERGGQAGDARQASDLRNVRQVALLVARAALARLESRGAHYRTDYPKKSEAFHQHSILRHGAAVTFR